MDPSRYGGGGLNRVWKEKYSHQRPEQVYTAEDRRDGRLKFRRGVSLFEYLNQGDKDNLIETLLGFSTSRLDPPGKYRLSALREFLSSAKITTHEGAVTHNGPMPRSIILDERRDPTDTTATTRHWDSDAYLRYPTAGADVYTAELDLNGLIRRLSEKRLENGAERRTLLVCDMTPSCAMVIIATAPTRSIPDLRSFFHDYLLSKPLFRAKMSTTFVLESHMPYFVLREGPAILDERRPRANRFSELNLLPLARPDEKDAYFYETKTSLILTGVDERLYTAICLVDTFFGGEQHREDYLDPNSPLDALTGGALWLRYPVWNPRQYWLVIQSHRISQAAKEWTDLINRFVDRLDFYERHFELPDDPRLTKTTALTGAERTIRLFRNKLANTVRAWDDFQSQKGSIFDVDNTKLHDHWQSYLGSIRESVSELKEMCAIMSQKLELFQSMREALVNASALKESTEATRQGNMIGILTMMTVLFLPSAFVTAFFSMLQLPNSAWRWIFYCLLVILFTTGTVFVARRPHLLRSLFVQESYNQSPRWYRYSKRRGPLS